MCFGLPEVVFYPLNKNNYTGLILIEGFPVHPNIKVTIKICYNIFSGSLSSKKKRKQLLDSLKVMFFHC